jgi:C-terminal processing protease CtpA/Prc
MVDKDFNDVEGVGVKPDIEIKYNRKRLESGYDDQLDRAIRYIRVGH